MRRLANTIFALAFLAALADVSRYFLKTGHHWNYDAAFLASERMAEKIVDILKLQLSSEDGLLRRNDRRFQSTNVAEYVLGLKPDIVVQLMYPGSFNPDFGDTGLGRHADKMFDYGLK